MGFDAYIFDLDGTLLDTLPDLVQLTNKVLQEHGWPLRTSAEVLSFVGDGGLALLRRAAPPEASDEAVQHAFETWEQLYPAYGHRNTRPYPGMPELLKALKARGAKLGVLSNKVDSAVGEVIPRYFPGIFDEARGECAAIPRKPDPAGLQAMLARFGTAPQQAAYLGDSAGDMLTARRAGAFPIGVTWGYQPRAALQEAGAALLVDAPAQILEA